VKKEEKKKSKITEEKLEITDENKSKHMLRRKKERRDKSICCNNKLLLPIIISIISLVALLLIVKNCFGVSELKSEINLLEYKFSEKEIIITNNKEKIDAIDEDINNNKKNIDSIGNLSAKNLDMINSIVEITDDLHNRVVTAQKGVNRLARVQLINLGYDDSLSFCIANEISVNPTINKWDKLISNSEFNFEKLNKKISNLNEKQNTDSVNIVKVNEEVNKLEDLLEKKHKLVLELLKNHGTKEMKSKLNK